jgi:hypothetical protein
MNVTILLFVYYFIKYSDTFLKMSKMNNFSLAGLDLF